MTVPFLPRPIARLLLAALPLLVVAGLVQPAPAAAEERALRMARLSQEPASVPTPASLGRPLSSEDVARYKLIFRLQEDGDWEAANRLMARLDSRLLLGHVLAQRYLHPTKYRSSYRELAAWLDDYADHPQAVRIHRLATKRRPAGASAPASPVEGYLRGHGQELRTARSGRAELREALQQGLSAWRGRRYAKAAEIFMALAQAENVGEEDVAAGAFWAARALMAGQRPQLVTHFLRVAARASDGFYGLLAQRLLGHSIAFEWHDEERLRLRARELLVRYPAARRALALGQVGRSELAEDEVRKLGARARPEMAYALAALAEAASLPGAQMRVAQRVRMQDGRRHDGALFPVPDWQPAGGFKVDRALVYAVIRAESAFDVEARSPAGAMGLMQLLPGTAAYVASLEDTIEYDGAHTLLDPERNIELGQAFLLRLTRSETVSRSLIHLMAAYNAGEGRLQGWLEKDLKGVGNDPLLFVESIPIAETRRYVKKVLTNLWAYRARLGQEIPELQALAENRWPELVALDGGRRHARAN
ncbi:lytic transglycosylase domain-containing protein (plasmid) [Geminicoccaceae bacterium 1502E]|nr:lytic transglycosylase domain-containing protein [Geminicoccaceae bacterium 1502E]